MAKKTAIEILQEERKVTTEKFIEALQKEGLKYIKKWQEIDAPSNGTTGKKYNGGNSIKLYMDTIEKGYSDSRYVTKKQAEKEGWKVKENSNPVMCEKWIFSKKEKYINELGKEEVKEITLKRPVANYFLLYNASQIEGIPFQVKEEKTTTNDYEELIKNLEKSSECIIKRVAQNEAYYSPSKDEIVLPTFKQFNSEQDYVSTLIHEMAHSTGHPSRMDRRLTGRDNLENYAKEELRAEISAVFLQKELGIKIKGEHFNNHESYIASWASALKKDPNELYKAGAEAEKITDYLKEKYLEHTKEQVKEIDPWTKKIEEFKSKEKELTI